MLTLEELMNNCRNDFHAENVEGSFSIKGGTVSLPFVSRYVKIEGSKYNDGVHEYPLTNLVNEDFTGAIIALNPPNAFLDLYDEIKEYVENNKASAFTSESFGGYSYTKATVNGKLPGWQDVFADRLKTWRRI